LNDLEKTLTLSVDPRVEGTNFGYQGQSTPGNPHEGDDMQVELKTLAPMRLAYMRHTGPYDQAGISKLWMSFDENGLAKPHRKRYGISQDNPATTPAEQCRYDACVEVDEAFQPQGEVGVQNFSGGRYACIRFTGTSAEVRLAWTRMFDEWLPQCGYAADNKPAIELYEEDFVMDPKTGAFNCLLCVPVRMP
jgi:AraC family transcriptional regulator